MNNDWDVDGRGGGDTMQGEVGRIIGGGLADHELFHDYDYDDDVEKHWEWTKLTPSTLIQLKRNDPNITHLSLSFGYSFRNAIDSNTFNWKRDGQFIGASTHLKKLAVDIVSRGDDGPERANFSEFYESLASNRSILHLQVGRTLQSDDDDDSRHPLLILPTSFYRDNHNLLSFQVEAREPPLGEKSLKSLVSCLKNRTNKGSLLQIHLDCGMADDESGGKMIDALHGYCNMKSLYLGRLKSMSSEKWCIALETLLASPSSKVERLVLCNNGIDNKGATFLGRGLAESETVKDLCLIHTNAMTNPPDLTYPGWRSIFGCLSSPKSTLEKLKILESPLGSPGAVALCNAIGSDASTKLKNVDIQCANIGDEQPLFHTSSRGKPADDKGSDALANILVRNTSWQYLNLSQSDWISSRGWQAICSSLSNPHLNIVNLDLSYNKICDIGVTALGSALGNNQELKRLCLQCNRSITSFGWRNFFRLLQNSKSALEEIHLNANHIRGEEVACMADGLVSIVGLKKLHLPDNSFITTAGWQRVARLLQHPALSLEELEIESDSYGSSINDEVVAQFANSLVNNSSLKRLDFGPDHYHGNEVFGYRDTLSNVLYDKTSIESIFASNHTLEEFHCEESIPAYLASYMQWNRGSDKKDVARRKILRHFLLGDGDIQNLIRMELTVMPRLVAWIGRYATALSLLYRLTRGTPSLFENDGCVGARGDKRSEYTGSVKKMKLNQ